MKYHLMYVLMIIGLFLTIALPESGLSAARLLVDEPADGPLKIFIPVVIRSGGSNQPPNIPSNPTPSNTATAQELTTTLGWTGGDPNGDAVKYDVYFEVGRSAPQIKVADHQAGTTFNLGTLTTVAHYYWKIVAFDSNGISTAGPVWDFTTTSGSIVSGEMVPIPAGAFQMGCDPASGYACDSDELPLHTVTLDAYRIDKTEVTNAQYTLCVAAGSCTVPGDITFYGNLTYASYPVVYVSRNQSVAYCAWAGKRIPTEAEWEKAARGPSDTRAFPWGNELPTCTQANYYDHGSYCDGKPGDVSAVGSYQAGASPYGALDMAGNVMEYVNDLYQSDYYSVSPSSNPTGPTTGTFRILRGGAVGSPYSMKVTNRSHGYWIPPLPSGVTGFRCVAAPGN